MSHVEAQTDHGDPAETLRGLRKRAEQSVEQLLAFLDATDGDPDLEPTMGWQPAPDECEGPDSDLEPDVDDELSGDEREPSLGSAEIPPTYTARVDGQWGTHQGDQTRWAAGSRDEREDDPAEGPIDDDEREPSLGWTTAGRCHGSDDLEDDATDDEPSLGWVTEQETGIISHVYATSDLEGDPAESGIGDAGGLAEQTGGAH